MPRKKKATAAAAGGFSANCPGCHDRVNVTDEPEICDCGNLQLHPDGRAFARVMNGDEVLYRPQRNIVVTANDSVQDSDSVERGDSGGGTDDAGVDVSEPREMAPDTESIDVAE